MNSTVDEWMSPENAAEYHAPQGFIHVGWFRHNKGSFPELVPFFYQPLDDGVVHQDWLPALIPDREPGWTVHDEIAGQEP